jgi:hypothetical protein
MKKKRTAASLYNHNAFYSFIAATVLLLLVTTSQESCKHQHLLITINGVTVNGMNEAKGLYTQFTIYLKDSLIFPNDTLIVLNYLLLLILLLLLLLLLLPLLNQN